MIAVYPAAASCIICRMAASTSRATGSISGFAKPFIISVGRMVASLYSFGWPYTEMLDGKAVEIAPSA